MSCGTSIFCKIVGLSEILFIFPSSCAFKKQAFKRFRESSKVTELVSDDQGVDPGPRCQFQGTFHHVMWCLLCVWAKQSPHSLLMREPESGHENARSRPPTTGSIIAPEHQPLCSVLKSISAFAEVSVSTSCSLPMTACGRGARSRPLPGRHGNVVSGLPLALLNFP